MRKVDVDTAERFAARRYALQAEMREEYVKTGDPYWRACAILDQEEAAEMSKFVRVARDIES